jgi:adenylosuccinate synthase
MPLDIVVGTQWGDEGKGRIVDLLAKQADIVARFNGGDNAGHTVTVFTEGSGSQTFKLHLIPSGVVHAHTRGILGSGMVVNPATFYAELDALRAAGVNIGPQRLQISFAAHLITPAHRALDRAQELARGSGQIGTTGRGIGPAYTDRAARRGLRLQDVLERASFHEKMLAHVVAANQQLAALGAEPLDAQAVAAEYDDYAVRLEPYVSDTGLQVWQALKQGKAVLAEGAQGTLLDLDAGTYPFVTSSNPTAAGALLGLGLGAAPIRRVIGVTKAFQTRVGAGPFPTEVEGETATRLRGTGANPWDEFGTTTGRPRRVGWLDGVLLRYAARLNGLTEIMMTKLDVLSGLDTIRICTAYRAGGKEYEQLPLGPADLSPFEPIYEELPGWQADLQSARLWEDLPSAAQSYIRRVEQIAGVAIGQVSVGPERGQVVDVAA